MRTISGLGVLVIVGVTVILVGGCRRDPAPSPEKGPAVEESAPPARRAAPPARPGDETGAGPVAVPPSGGEAAVAGLLTDDKVKRYLVYQREIAAGAKGIGGMIGEAAPQVRKGDRPAVRGDDQRVQGLGSAGQSGLAKSGLPQEEINQLATVLTPYYAKRMMAVDAAASLAKAKGPIMTKIFQKQVDQGTKLRADFEQQHGKAARAAVDKHEKEAIEIQSLIVKNALQQRK